LSSAIDKYVLHHELVERFPNIKLIDNVSPQSAIKFPIPQNITAAVNPFPVKGSFFDSQNSQVTSANFINRYFQIFDSEDTSHRQKLYGVYTPHSCFSLAITAGIRGTVHEQFLKSNRNFHESTHSLAKLSQVSISASSSSSSSSSFSNSSSSSNSTGATTSFIKVGPLHITYALEQFPKTKHNVKDFIADVFLVPVSGTKLLNVSIRGNFLEAASNVIYSFHRIFVLTPPSSEQAHWPALVLNDQLTISNVVPNT